MQSRRKCVKKFYILNKHYFRASSKLKTGSANSGVLPESIAKVKAIPVALSSLLILKAIYLDQIKRIKPFFLPLFVALP